MAFLGVHIENGLAEKFAALAVTEGGKSAVLRRLVEEAVGAGGSRVPAAIPAGSSCKVTIRLRKTELRQLTIIAAQRGMNRTQWITSLVRAWIGFPVQQTRDERQALRAVARELNCIGGNINQIARAANIDRLLGQTVRVEAKAIRAASAGIEVALAELRGALARNADYWEGRR